MSERDTSMADLRARIEELDAEVIRLLGERFDLVRMLAREKEVRGLPVENRPREEALRRLYREHALRAGLDPELVLGVFELVLARSKAEQGARGKRPRSA